MRENLLRRNITIIAIASVVLAGLILLIMKLRFFDAVNTKIAAANTAYGAQSLIAEKLGDNLQAQKIAENNRQFAGEQVNAFRARFRSLTFDLDDTKAGARPATWRRYLNEYYTDYGVEMRRELIQAADESGVVLSTSVKVNAPPQNPEDVVSPPGGFLKPLADGSLSVTVEGSFSNLLRFFDRINRTEILMTTGNITSPGVRLEATEAGERATFVLTPYLVASGPSAQLPTGAPVVVAGGDAATTGSPSGPSPQSTRPGP